MAVEDDTLKTLIRIENLLKASNQSTGQTGGAGTASRIARTRAAAGNREDRKQGKVFTATTRSMDDLGDAADDVGRRFGKLSKTVFATQGQFVALNKSMRVFSRRPNLTPNNAANETTGGGSTLAQGISQLFGPRSAVSRSVTSFAGNLSLGRLALVGFATQLGAAASAVTDDFFLLASRGISNSAASMSGLYVDAIRAGMSLKEYTQLLQENSVAVVRAGSMADFNRTLQVSNEQLKGLGVFGAEANKLSATMASSATSLGVPQADLTKATSAQVNIFEQLRKTSMITSEQFAKLNEQLANNEDVQAELLGMEPRQRAARLRELQQTNAIGISMGLTEDASQKLGQALLAQRKLTAVQRFQSAGTIRQAGAIAGLGASESERLAMLSRRKNRTAEENAEFTQLGGRLQASLERMQNSGNIQQENAADQLQERLNAAGIGQQLAAAGQARLQSQSGPLINKAIGDNTGKAAGYLGEILTILKGLSANPLATVLIAGLGSAAFAATMAFAVRRGMAPAVTAIESAVGRGVFGKPGVPDVDAPGKKGGIGKWGGRIAGLAGGLLAMAPAIFAASSSLSDLSTAQEAIAKEDTVENRKKENEAIGMGLGSTLGAGIGVVLSGALAVFTGGLGGLLTPIVTTLTTGLGATVGSWIGGLLTSDKKTEAQTKATEKNTAEIKKNTSAVLKPDVLTTTRGLTGNLMATARGVSEDTTVKARNVAEENRAAKLAALNEHTKEGNARRQALMKQAENEVYTPENPNATRGDVKRRFEELMARELDTKIAETSKAVATPQPPQRPNVTPPEAVNTAQAEAAGQAAASAATQAASSATTPTTDMASLVNQIIALLTQGLSVEKEQVALTQQLITSRIGPVPFADMRSGLNRAVSGSAQ